MLEGEGIRAGLINKATLNVVDDTMMRRLSGAAWILVVEGWNVKTGLGSQYGSQLLSYGFKGRYRHLGANREGSGGLWQQIGYQGLDPKAIAEAIRQLDRA